MTGKRLVLVPGKLAMLLLSLPLLSQVSNLDFEMADRYMRLLV
nr:hypothetical protein Q903MT_gene324 [Picea sitchensis]